MSLFNLRPPPPQEEEIRHHPWEKTIKGQYANKIKYAHNSVNNPEWPKKEKNIKKPAPAERIKFTVVGNRVTKEFIYCMHIVKGLHKWRRRLYDEPVIRGVSSVEWPSVWNDLKRQHGGMAYCLRSQVAVLINDHIIGGENELKDYVKNKYNYHLTIDYHKEGVAQFASFIKGAGRPCAYMHISVDGTYIGTLIFMLYADLVPNTCENVLRLCQLKKGGYGGTPVHRIVKDGWIQCGGFGLQGTDLDCENFIVPHDRRGVLCMANAERHMDCSTQFFVLLQPAPWMACKYVAFGQLIDGESTLEKIENVPTWYESPTSEIIIHQAGILNLDCHDFIINKGTKEYIQAHIDDLVALGDSLYEELLQIVFLEVELRNLQRLTQVGIEDVDSEDETLKAHSTKRIHRKPEDQPEEKRRGSSLCDKTKRGSEDENRHTVSFASDGKNDEFDVEMYEPEEYSYKPASVVDSTIIEKPERPFFCLPLTDVPYPGEVDSNFDLKKLLRGDYCLESDLQQNIPKKVLPRDVVSYISDIIAVDSSSTSTLDTDDERELQKYVKRNADRVSFAGQVIKKIGKTVGTINIHQGSRYPESKHKSITDDDLRKLRIVSAIYDEATSTHDPKDKKVSLCLPKSGLDTPHEIKRRQTGFVRPEDLEEVHIIHKSSAEIKAEKEEAELRKVHMSPSSTQGPGVLRQSRRPTGFVRNMDDSPDSDVEIQKSVLDRLYDQTAFDSEVGPTLKNYRPMSEITNKNIFLMMTPNQMKENETRSEWRYSLTYEQSVQDVLKMQHGVSLSRKISSDYVKTIGHIEHHPESSIRSIEFAKKRPTISVSEYQLKNKKYREDLKNQALPQEFLPLPTGVTD